MKKLDVKFVLIWVLCAFISLIIKGILDSFNASTIMYLLAWIPMLICFIYDFKYIYNKLEK
ncbi:hypothetical protein [Clostridium prolinivorans]|uniref:hypothetical protein n=1 Tax=Clostridium prolinivorans TaxID=2769420 RepID=UPI000FD901BD|nr:hypothetical protein [Clostridium prolinivorans]